MLGPMSHSLDGLCVYVSAEHVGVQSCCLGGLLGLVQDKQHGHSHTTRLAQAQGLQVRPRQDNFDSEGRSRGGTSHQDMGWKGLTVAICGVCVLVCVVVTASS